MMKLIFSSPHVIFLEQKGYEVSTINNGAEAVDMVKDEYFDIVFLDETCRGCLG